MLDGAVKNVLAMKRGTSALPAWPACEWLVSQPWIGEAEGLEVGRVTTSFLFLVKSRAQGSISYDC